MNGQLREDKIQIHFVKDTLHFGPSHLVNFRKWPKRD